MPGGQGLGPWESLLPLRGASGQSPALGQPGGLREGRTLSLQPPSLPALSGGPPDTALPRLLPAAHWLSSLPSWYLKAQHVAPKNGRPYNQLALLAVYTVRGGLRPGSARPAFLLRPQPS